MRKMLRLLGDNVNGDESRKQATTTPEQVEETTVTDLEETETVAINTHQEVLPKIFPRSTWLPGQIPEWARIRPLYDPEEMDTDSESRDGSKR